jgi:hypothetical protein
VVQVVYLQTSQAQQEDRMVLVVVAVVVRSTAQQVVQAVQGLEDW